jgi:alpha-glucosidase
MRLLSTLSLVVAFVETAAAQNVVTSPDARTQVAVEVNNGGLFYRIDRDRKPLLMPSRLGFEFQGALPIKDGLRITGSTPASHDETWTQPWGEVSKVRDYHNEIAVSVEESAAPNRRFILRVRAFNDGIGFRYELPEQPGLGEFTITDELTEFAFVENPKAWFIPSNRPRRDRSEMLYSSSPMSLIEYAQTPLTMETRSGTYVVIHEANLVDYARMNLKGGAIEGKTLRSALAPMANGTKVVGKTPFMTPWRTIQIADRATDLAPSVLGLNLNPPNVLPTTDWIKPMKYVGIWWGMHIGTMTWASGAKHGATTQRTKQYIDFAAANGLGGVLV